MDNAVESVEEKDMEKGVSAAERKAANIEYKRTKERVMAKKV